MSSALVVRGTDQEPTSEQMVAFLRERPELWRDVRAAALVAGPWRKLAIGACWQRPGAALFLASWADVFQDGDGRWIAFARGEVPGAFDTPEEAMAAADAELRARGVVLG